MSTTGTIREWHHDEGWGVIESPALSGTVHVTAFVVRVRAVQNIDELSLPGLRPGTVVDFDHAIAVPPESGCRYVALSVWPTEVAGPDPKHNGVFRTALWHSVGDAGPDGLTIIEETALTDTPTSPPPTTLGPNTTGTVRSWNGEEGWGRTRFRRHPGRGVGVLQRDRRYRFPGPGAGADRRIPVRASESGRIRLPREQHPRQVRRPERSSSSMSSSLTRRPPDPVTRARR